MTESRKTVTAGLLLALALTLPALFHALGMGGPIFLPMHLPVLVAGLLLSVRHGFLVGLAAPVLSSLMTGMPPLAPFPMAFIMAAELAALGGAAGFARGRLPLVPAMLSGMVAARITAGIAVFLVVRLFAIPGPPVSAFIFGALLTAAPGLLLQFLLAPPIVLALERTVAERREIHEPA